MVEVRRRSLDPSLLDLQRLFTVCVHADTLHVHTSKELLSCSSIHNVPSLESYFFPYFYAVSSLLLNLPPPPLFPLAPSFTPFIPVLSFHSLVANQASSRIHGVAHDVGLR